MRSIKITGIAVFCLMLLVCAALSFCLPQKSYSDIENRSLETKPEWNAADLLSGEYQEHYETYLNDQMFLRDRWVGLAAAIERTAGKKEVNGVYIGKDGYLLEKYSASDFDNAQIKENIRILSSFLNDAVKQYGARHVSCLLVPDKSDAMPDKLPKYAKTGIEKVKSAAAQLAQSLHKPGILLDTRTQLLSHQDEYIYYRSDHHWTTLGAYYAYRRWADATRHTALPLDSYQIETAFDDFYGTTYNKAQIRVPPDKVELFHSAYENGITVDDGETVSDSFYFKEAATKGFNRYQVFFSRNTAKIHIRTNAGTGRSLLVIKDSFANCFVPFLAGDYEQILMVDCRYASENIHDMLKNHDEITDVLVLYNITKFMQDKNLHKLDKKADGREAFDAESFFDE